MGRRAGNVAAAVPGGYMDRIRRLYEKYAASAYRRALFVLGPSYEDHAWDVVQESFIAIIRKMEHYEGKPIGLASILKVTTNTTINYIRREKRKLPITWLSAELVGDPNTSEGGAEREAAIREAFFRLSETERWLVTLRYLDGLSLEKIAEVVGFNRKKVAKMLARAVRKLCRAAGPPKNPAG